jgi:hypothetical protein
MMDADEIASYVMILCTQHSPKNKSQSISTCSALLGVVFTDFLPGVQGRK